MRRRRDGMRVLRRYRWMPLLVLVLTTSCRCDLEGDREALLALYNSTGGSDWTNNTGWVTNAADLSSWYGITVNETYVSEIELEDNNLRGQIPAEIGNLTDLRRLYLPTNFLTGPIPPDVGRLKSLELMTIGENMLSGVLPTELGELGELQDIWLGANDFEGDIPPALGNLSKLRALSLYSNGFTGTIPPHFGNLTDLYYLNLADNVITGDIPEEIGVLASHYSLQRTLWLSTNYLTGSVPDGIVQSTIYQLSLAYNLLSDWPDQRPANATAPPAEVDALATTAPSTSARDGGVDTSDGTGNETSDSNRVAIIAGGSIGSVVVVIGAAAAAFCLLRRRRKSAAGDRSKGLPVKKSVSRRGSRSGVSPSLSLDADDSSEDEENGYSCTRENLAESGAGGGDALASTLSARVDDPGSAPGVRGKGSGRGPTPQTGAQEGRDLQTKGSSIHARGQAAAESLHEGAASTVMEIATAALAAAEALVQQSYIPGVKEAATAVGGLVRLVADNKSNPRDIERRVRWCRSIVLTLERAAELLGQAREHRSGQDAERVLLEDVQDSVTDMVQIVQSYKSKNMVSRLLVSTLCKKRQEEAEAAINAAVHRLQLGLQVRAGHKLESVGQAVEKGLQMQQRASQHSHRESKQQRKKKRLDQLEIPVDEVDITDEMLGRGGFGTVYLADYNGINAAAKVVQFERDQSSDDEDEHIDYDGGNIGSDEGGQDGERPRRDESVGTRSGQRRNRGSNARRDGVAEEDGRTPSSRRSSRSEATQRRAFMRELEAMKRLRGPHTVHIYGAITSASDRLVLVMELLPGGDLRYKLKKAKGPLSETVLRGILRDVCAGMTFLHSKNTVHGDLKSANILFDAMGTAKIADFGTSRWSQQTTRLATYTTRPAGSIGLSLPWAAPEILNKGHPSFESDVYSYGVVMWECLSRSLPWKDVPGVDKLLLAVTSGERPAMPSDAPPDLVSLTETCWAQESANRPSFKSVLSSLNAHGAEPTPAPCKSGIRNSSPANGTPQAPLGSLGLPSSPSACARHRGAFTGSGPASTREGPKDDTTEFTESTSSRSTGTSSSVNSTRHLATTIGAPSPAPQVATKKTARTVAAERGRGERRSTSGRSSRSGGRASTGSRSGRSRDPIADKSKRETWNGFDDGSGGRGDPPPAPLRLRSRMESDKEA